MARVTMFWHVRRQGVIPQAHRHRQLRRIMRRDHDQPRRHLRRRCPRRSSRRHQPIVQSTLAVDAQHFVRVMARASHAMLASCCSVRASPLSLTALYPLIVTGQAFVSMLHLQGHSP